MTWIVVGYLGCVSGALLASALVVHRGAAFKAAAVLLVALSCAGLVAVYDQADNRRERKAQACLDSGGSPITLRHELRCLRGVSP